MFVSIGGPLCPGWCGVVGWKVAVYALVCGFNVGCGLWVVVFECCVGVVVAALRGE